MILSVPDLRTSLKVPLSSKPLFPKTNLCFMVIPGVFFFERLREYMAAAWAQMPYVTGMLIVPNNDGITFANFRHQSFSLYCSSLNRPVSSQ